MLDTQRPQQDAPGSHAHAGAVHEPPAPLPDFCGIRTVFFVVLLAELLALGIVLVSSDGLWRRLDYLALTSLLVQWLALTSAAGLCLARPLLSRLAPVAAMSGALLLVLAIVGLVSELAWQVAGHYEALGVQLASSHGDFLARNVAVAAIVAALALRYLYLQFQWRRQVQAESEARLQALQARIRPHFFFNCMNTIASLIRSKPEIAEGAVEDLADLLRASLADARPLSTLAEEAALCRQYLNVEALRLGERLAVQWDIDALPPAVPLPSLTLQPLVENAIYHGVEQRAEGGRVLIRGWRENGRLQLEVRNPLPGPGAAGRAGNRLAQDNVRQRLGAHFGDAARLETVAEDGEYVARMTWPAPDGEGP